MAITRLGGANAITGTLPAANINNTSIGNVTSLPAAITTGSLVKLHSSSISSDTASVSIDGHFTSDYDVYKFIVYDLAHATDNTAAFFRANVGGSAQSSGIYWSAGEYATTDGSGTSSDGNFGTYSNYNQQYFGWVSSLNNVGNAARFAAEITLFNPLQTTKHKDIHYKVSYQGNNDNLYREDVVVKVTTTSAISGLTFLASSGNIANGEFVLYGVKK